MAALLTYDGVVMSSALSNGITEAPVSGVGAALLSLGRHAIANLKRGEFEQVLVQGSDGSIVITGAGTGTLLLVVTRPQPRLSLVFYDMETAVAELNRLCQI